MVKYVTNRMPWEFLISSIVNEFQIIFVKNKYSFYIENHKSFVKTILTV